MNQPGGYRTYKTIDVTLRRDLQNGWGWQVSGSKIWAKGNSVSVSDRDLQGDYADLDARLPYNDGKLDGSVDWILKGYVIRQWDNGFAASLHAYFDSGTHYSLMSHDGTFPYWQSPSMSEGYDTQKRGDHKNPSRSRFDFKVQYSRKFGKKVNGMVYLQVNDLLNKQGVYAKAEGPFARPGYSEGQGYLYAAPRSYALGMRVSF